MCAISGYARRYARSALMAAMRLRGTVGRAMLRWFALLALGPVVRGSAGQPPRTYGWDGAHLASLRAQFAAGVLPEHLHMQQCYCLRYHHRYHHKKQDQELQLDLYNITGW